METQNNDPNQAGSAVPIYVAIDVSASMTPLVGDVSRFLTETVNRLSQGSFSAAKIWLSVLTYSEQTSALISLTPVHLIRSIPTLVAGGRTRFSPLFEKLEEQIQADVAMLKHLQLNVYTPIVLVLSDGEPTDPRHEWRRQLDSLKSHPTKVIAVGVADVDPEVIRTVASSPDLAFINRSGSISLGLADGLSLISSLGESVTNSVTRGRDASSASLPESLVAIPSVEW